MKIQNATERTVKAGTVIKFAANGIWNNTKATKQPIKVSGLFNEYGLFEFSIKIGSTLRRCQVDYSELV